ncbi:pyridoxal-dependent decarboxylase [Stylonychia lemnae]|uniref:phenylalanine 4-monooxygenase n=1 Tax=Stylonychia lemnae TaxID=5949 RepID=A0A078AKW1_STYLE|nr:pyridoxal-dependent decarboxylase [Stylonychia lemnae]|eukprot:CDW81453.1 pyridoxal-dependent decarboxylase [Stylonychia lemnae]
MQKLTRNLFKGEVSQIMKQEIFLKKNIKSAKSLSQIYSDKDYISRTDKIMAQYDIENATIPIIKYNKDEKFIWATVYNNYLKILENHACEEVQDAFDRISKSVKLSENEIPQLKTISSQIQMHQGWKVRPVPGLISDQDYLEGLSNRVYCSTQIIRRTDDLLFSPYPDYIHDLLGHIIPIGSKKIAQNLQKLGTLSLNASPDQIQQIASIYWKIFEMGFIKTKNNEYKALGGAVLSSYQELQNISSSNVKIEHLRNLQIGKKQVNDELLQNEYFYIDRIEDIDEVIENLRKSWENESNKTDYFMILNSKQINAPYQFTFFNKNY